MADWPGRLNVRVNAHDPEKWVPVFEKDHAQARVYPVKAAPSRQLTTIRPPPISPLTSAG